MLAVSIGICAYNEERNIGHLLDAIMGQRLAQVTIADIFVVSSGSTDQTENIVLSYAPKDGRIHLLRQDTRQGKASAINEFLKAAEMEINVLISADVLPLPDTIEKLCLPFLDKPVGMTGGKVIPINQMDSFLGFAGNMLWGMHHQIALRQPKMGEMVAFRKVINSIPVDTAVDEAFIEAAVSQAGYKIIYVPEAMVYNKTPETVADFLRQRRRIYAGHLDLKKRFHYQPSTMSARVLLPIALSHFGWNPQRNLWALGTIALEAYGRWLGWYDFRVKKKSHAIWEISTTTKNTAERRQL